MRKLVYLAAALALAIASFAGGALWSRRPAGGAQREQKAVSYTCPMHPQYRSDRAGDCPSCGMRLEPVAEDGAGPGPSGGVRVPVGTVRVSHERQQAIGVRLGAVERVSGLQTLRTTGRVAPNENAVYPLVAGSEGWVREVRGATTGSLVRKNELLLSFYSPEIVTAQQSWFAGLDTLGRVGAEQLKALNENRVVEGVERQANLLRNLGVSELQLKEMQETRRLVQNVHMLSPVNGFVLARNASAGLRFDRGFEFFRIADLTEVWILADVYENQLPFIRAGSTARATSNDQNRTFEARVSRAEPIFDDATRTLKVRLETSNPGFTLKPGMFVDVEFAVELPESLAVPADAIVDTGLRRTVFVDRGNGYFEPRQIETGWRIGGQVEVVRGLMAGERIVISGTFLIDSESRMKAAAAGVFGAAAKDPVCGMDVDEKRATAAGRVVEHRGARVYFCSDECKHRFEADPGRFTHPRPSTGKMAAPQRVQGGEGTPLPTEGHRMPARASKPVPTAQAVVHEEEAGPAKDLVCGMDVDRKEAAAANRVVEHAGKRYYFCSDDCRAKFAANPREYLGTAK